MFEYFREKYRIIWWYIQTPEKRTETMTMQELEMLLKPHVGKDIARMIAEKLNCTLDYCDNIATYSLRSNYYTLCRKHLI